MEKKLLAVLLIGLLAFSTLNLTLADKVKCPECRGTGEIACPYCDGTGQIGEEISVECEHCSGTGQLTPNLLKKSMVADKSSSTTDVTAVYVNKEDFDVNANITARLDDRSVTSEEITFPSGEEVTVVLSIPYVTYYTCLLYTSPSPRD